jgi:DNA polymerase
MDSQQKETALKIISDDITRTRGGPFGPGLNPVPGEGNPEAEVMFIGEAPGFNENEQGRPFVGVSGQLLRKTMAENGLPPESVYITNIVKFRPPGNRDPSPEEIEFFRPFLDQQIEVIDPEIIVTVGRFSMYKFFGAGVSISKIHGQPRKIGKFMIFPMFHPAAALRAGDVMKEFIADFAKLKSYIEELHKPKTETPKTVSPRQMELM